MEFKLPAIIPPIEDEKGRRNLHVIRIGFGDKFYITKSTNLEWTMKELRRVLSQYRFARRSEGISETNLFYPLVKAIVKDDQTKVAIDILFTSTVGYQVLKFELEQLAEHFGKPGCLNANNTPYVPRSVKQKGGSNWLTENERLNYAKLLKTYKY